MQTLRHIGCPRHLPLTLSRQLRLISGLFAWALISSVLPSLAKAQAVPPDQSSPALAYEGNWLVTWEDHPRLSIARITLSKGLRHGTDCTAEGTYGFCRDAAAGWSAISVEGKAGGPLTQGGSVSVKAIEGGGGIEAVHEHQMISKLAPSEGGQLLVGTWRRGDSTGREIWRRLPPIEIRRVHCRSARGGDISQALGTSADCLVKIDHVPGKDAMRGNLPGFWIDVYGQYMWGVGALPLLIDAAGLEVASYCFTYENLTGADGEPGCHSYGIPWPGWGEVTGLRIGVNVFHGATSGPKRLSLNGTTVPFILDLPAIAPSSPPAETGKEDVDVTIDVET